MSATLPGIELVVAKRFVHVLAEGPPDRFFEELALPPPSPGTVEGTVEEIVFQVTGDLCKDIVKVRATGLTIMMTTSLHQKTFLLPIYAMSLTLTVSMRANHGVGMAFAVIKPSP